MLETLPRESFLGVDFVAATCAAAGGAFIESVRDGSASGSVHFANSYTMSLASADHELQRTLSSAAAVFPDGWPIPFFAGRASNLRQVRGPEFFEHVLREGDGLRHFFLGSTDETLDRLRENCKRRFPGADIVGVYSPPFGAASEEETAKQQRILAAAAPDVVWVGLGTPKQDFHAMALSDSTPGVFVAVGAAFDFVAGTKRRAPAWVRALRLEWLHRWAQEPRRLSSRYTTGTFQFLRSVARHHR